jgi:tRNA dimethylallyltransferase
MPHPLLVATIKEEKTVNFLEFLPTKKLIVILGPTGVGKTDLSISIAKELHCPIISADSRQIYKELNIGVAKPTSQQLAEVPHYFIGTRSVTEDYTAGKYESDAIELLTELYQRHDIALLVGGSGLYIDAVCYGIDATPEADEELRNSLMDKLEKEGLESLTQELKILDPDFYNQVDLKNPARILRALEICLITGKPYSKIRQNSPKNRIFDVSFIGINRNRAELYDRINLRVEQMMQEGLLKEAESMLPYRDYNALKTVGYREFFDFFDGKITLEEAVELVKRNSRRYAKRQLSWFGRYDNINWFDASNADVKDNILKTLS